MKIIIIIGIIFSVWFFPYKNQEIKNIPSLNVGVYHRKSLLGSSSVDIRNFNGELLARKKVSERVEREDIEVHLGGRGVVIFTGESDWVWFPEEVK